MVAHARRRDHDELFCPPRSIRLLRITSVGIAAWMACWAALRLAKSADRARSSYLAELRHGSHLFTMGEYRIGQYLIAAVAVPFGVLVLWAGRRIWQGNKAGYVTLLVYGLAGVYELVAPSPANIASAIVGAGMLACLATRSSRRYALTPPRVG